MMIALPVRVVGITAIVSGGLYDLDHAIPITAQGGYYVDLGDHVPVGWDSIYHVYDTSPDVITASYLCVMRDAITLDGTPPLRVAMRVISTPIGYAVAGPLLDYSVLARTPPGDHDGIDQPCPGWDITCRYRTKGGTQTYAVTSTDPDRQSYRATIAAIDRCRQSLRGRYIA